MIIQKLATAIRGQDWFQVLIEVLIVIVGIFLGLQVQAWYEDSAERDLEYEYLHRLHTESIESLNFTAENYETLLLPENFRQIENGIVEVLHVFEGINNETELTPHHCTAIIVSHVYNDQKSNLPTITDLLASGQISLLQSADLKLALMSFTLSHNALKDMVNFLSTQTTPLAQKYPQFITRDRMMLGVVDASQHNNICSFDAMKEDVAFNNDLGANATKLNSFNLTLAKREIALHALHNVLDKELGIIHDDDGN